MIEILETDPDLDGLSLSAATNRVIRHRGPRSTTRAHAEPEPIDGPFPHLDPAGPHTGPVAGLDGPPHDPRRAEGGRVDRSTGPAAPTPPLVTRATLAGRGARRPARMAPGQCRHPVGRRIGDRCGACGAVVR